MPVLKVNYKINNVYLGYSKTTESLILEITTNGSVSPEKALSEAAQKLMTWFSFLTSEQHLAPQKEVEVEPIAQNDVILIEELQLPVRAYNCLKRAGINSVDDLVNYSQEEIREIKNFGKKSAQEVFQALKDKFDKKPVCSSSIGESQLKLFLLDAKYNINSSINIELRDW